MEQRIVLASASPRRRQLLSLLCPRYDVKPSGFDESTVPPGLAPAEHAVRSAVSKAADVASSERASIVIGADTIVVLGDYILGKPVDAEDAGRMLRALSARVHQVITGIAVVGPDARVLSGFESTDVVFRELSDSLIERYVATGEPMDKAGAYAIQERGAILVESIRGDFFNVVGLPLYRLSLLLERLGVEMLRP